MQWISFVTDVWYWYDNNFQMIQFYHQHYLSVRLLLAQNWTIQCCWMVADFHKHRARQ